MKRLALLVVFLLSMSVFVSAEFSKENAVEWLKSNTENKWSSLGNDIEKISFAVLALDINNEDVSQGVSYLKSKGSGCYPTGNCNTKDTALAALALDSVGEDISQLESYLDGNLKSSGSGSEGLIIQIITGESGSCSFSYDNGKTYSKIINNENPWVYLSQIGINFDTHLEEISVSCDFDSSPRISLIKENNNNFYIIDEKGLINNAQFKIESGCYSLNSDSSSCDIDSTFYASWVLHMLNSDVYTLNYMRNNVGNDPLRSAMLGLIDDSELGNLIGMQSNDGSFDSIYKTSFAIDALKNSDYSTEKENAMLYIESQQSESGNIGDLKNTAAVLYLVYRSVFSGGDGEGSSGYCGDGTVDFDEECEYNSDCLTGEQCSLQCACEPIGDTSFGECGNGICENNENSIICPVDCVDVSNSCGNGICELSKGEDSFVCNNDCYCGDFICDDSEKTSGSCSQDCETSGSSGGSQESYCGDGFCDANEDSNICSEDCSSGSRSLWWLWLVIIILIVGGGIFVYLKMKKGGSAKGNESNNFRVPPSRPVIQNVQGPQPRRNVRDDRLEKQLDESIKKAKELLKK